MKTPLRRQRGFALIQLVVALIIATLLAVFSSREIVRGVNDATAEATGRYLLTVRNALVAFQVKHDAWLLKVNTSGAPAGIYPAAPALVFAPNGSGQEIANADVSLLRNEALLPDSFSDSMPYGERARLLLVRSGACPGLSCQLQSYVYSCLPISRYRTRHNGAASCTNVPAGRDEADPSLLGQVLISVEGYGSHDLSDNTRFLGPLVNAPRAWFPISAHQGRAVVVASLDATPYAQFVRQGDTRHIFLRNDLTVDGAVQTNTGLIFGNSVTLGQSCNRERMFASTNGGELAVCIGGTWQSQPDHSVTSIMTRRNGESVSPPNCPAPMQVYRMISLNGVDMQVTQGTGGMKVDGTLSGGVSGSGSVNAAGSVSVSGSFSGTFNASPSSYVQMGQTASLSGNTVVISNARPGSSATVIQGCKLN